MVSSVSESPHIPRKDHALRAHNDVVDWNVDKLDEESNETHDAESNCCGHCNFLELFPIWLCASFDKPDGVLGELLGRFNRLLNLIHICKVMCLRETYRSQDPSSN